MKRLMTPLSFLCFTAIMSSTAPVWASNAQTQLKAVEDVTSEVVIYNALSDGKPKEQCRIPFSNEVLNVNMGDNKYGCNNDDAYYISLQNVPSATKIWLMSEKDCNFNNTNADWVFKLIARKKSVSTDTLNINGLRVALETKQSNPDKAVIVTAGVELTGGQFVRPEINGKLSCVRIEPSTPDTSQSPNVTAPSSAFLKNVNGGATSPELHAPVPVINFYGKPDSGSKLYCSIPIKNYTYHLAAWEDRDGVPHDKDDGGYGCPNDDIYALELSNVPSATRIYLSSESSCDMNEYPEAPGTSWADWIIKLKTTQKSVTTPGNDAPYLQLNDLISMESNKVVAPPHAGLLLTRKIHNRGKVGGKLSCVQIIVPTPDI